MTENVTFQRVASESQELADRQREMFAALKKERDALSEQIREQARDIFAGGAKEIFEKYGDKVGRFGWTQYTPYFNDGDPCVFSVNDLFIHSHADMQDPDFEGNNYYESSEEFYGYSEKSTIHKTLWRRERDGHVSADPWRKEGYVEFENPNYDPKYGDAFTDINVLRNLMDEDTLQTIFGDHCVVIASADGVEVEEYSHD